MLTNSVVRKMLNHFGCWAIVIASLGWITPSNAYDYQRTKDIVAVNIHISGEDGQPIPYVTVWTASLPRPGYPLALAPDDLWRITQRYQSSFEFATYYNGIVNAIHVTLMGNKDGVFEEKFDYQGVNGYPNKRPDQMQLSYTFMKRGYLPAQLNIPVGHESNVRGKITLKRDPNNAIETQAYLQRFEAIRYELSDTRKDEKISIETHERNENIRKELEELAKQAVAANDNKAAARIYMRMAYLPSIEFFRGKPSGWSHQKPYSEQAIEYRKQAYELDKDNSYIVAASLYDSVFPRGSPITLNKIEDTERINFEQYLINFELFYKKNKAQIWPKQIQIFAALHELSIDEKQFLSTEKWWREFYEFEPKLVTKEFVEEAVSDFKKKKFSDN
jgi:hypothetical protein